MAKQSGISISGKSKSDVLDVFCELLDNRKNNSLPKSEKKSVKPFSCKKGKRYTTGHDGMC